jgi:general secretion pathway protein G
VLSRTRRYGGTAVRRYAKPALAVTLGAGVQHPEHELITDSVQLWPPRLRNASAQGDNFTCHCHPTALHPYRPNALPPYRRTAAFTLIEILVVITVIAILASLVTPMVFRNVGDAKVSATRAQIEILGLALDTYRLDNDYYPSTAQGLDALRQAPSGEPAARNWRGPYLKKSVPLDPYNRPYVYRSPGEANPGGYDLLSLGRDGQPGGSGEDADVTSWDSKGR